MPVTVAVIVVTGCMAGRLFVSTEERKSLEFGGVPGNLLMIFGLPVFTAYLYFCVRWNGGALLPGPSSDVGGFLASLRPTWQAAVAYAVWFTLQAALQQWAPGKVVEGTELPKGGRLRYKMNGLASLAISLASVAGLHFSGLWSIRFIYDSFGSLLSVMTIFVVAFSFFLYAYGKSADQGEISGVAIHDFWMGTGHNPRVPAKGGLFDLKFFCEARPGLILWMIINASFAYVQWEEHGHVTLAMILVCAFQLFYIIDYFWNEPAILTTMDIKHENFGYMLAFGDLVWVPMTYSLQAFYLIEHTHSLPWWGVVVIVVTNMTGLYIFRSVNSQKHTFRSDPENATIWGRKVEYLQTRTGSKLLLSGFWGWSRHFNYVGDILMALSWSLPCLFGSVVPYFYPIYFAALLIHRERRDHHHCTKKYGEDWDAYCAKVPWRIVPGVY
jgi:protein-S-isoprenylcysteine O-methyltransferase Ste14